MTKTLLKRLRRAQDGITGLETAIILIAFVVVASVFAYTVLSAGIFSAEKGKEAIHSGLQQARSSMELSGAVHATGVTADTLDNADDDWTASVNVTSAVDATDKKEGAASVGLTIAAGFTTGLAAYEDFVAADITNHFSARLWVKSSVDTAAGDLELVLDDSAGCGSPLEQLDIPALTANTWTQVQMKLADPSLLTAAACVGIEVETDNGAQVVDVDLVEAPGEISQVHVTVTNSLDGEAINLATTTDADSDGLVSDEATKNHFMTVDFIDSAQRVSDIAWTKTQVGKGDGDDLLEPGEKTRITVSMEALSPVPVGSSTFTVYLRPATGSTLAIERTLPIVIDANMSLN
jgi:archaellin